MYQLLENEIVPLFYRRDGQGVPQEWIAKVRASMARLTPRFSSNRMVTEYAEKAYLPAAKAYLRRAAENGQLGASLLEWHGQLADGWRGLRFDGVQAVQADNQWVFQVRVYLGELRPAWVRVELYGEAPNGQPPICLPMESRGMIAGAVNGYIYTATAPNDRPADFYTPRVVPHHPAAYVPAEEAHILWQR
jgi:starch phosphorylase